MQEQSPQKHFVKSTLSELLTSYLSDLKPSSGSDNEGTGYTPALEFLDGWIEEMEALLW